MFVKRRVEEFDGSDRLESLPHICVRTGRGSRIISLPSQKKTISMNINKNVGLLVLAIYLIIVGLTGLFSISLGQLSIVVPLMALVAGILILIGR